jgi:hypothetical protein
LSLTLTWSSTGATGCIASGGWSGTKAVSGSEVVTKSTTGATAYTLTCTEPGDTTAALSWTPPIQNTDGTPLTNLQDYRVYSRVGTAPFAVVQTLAAPRSAFTFTGLAPGAWEFSLTARNTAGTESAQSSVASKTLTAPSATTVTATVTGTAIVVPNPPSNVTIAVVVGANVAPAYKILANGARSDVLAGFVPAGKACDGPVVFTYRGSKFKRVAPADVQWWSTTSTSAVAAPCG